MAMDTVTGRRSDERPACGHRTGVVWREADQRGGGPREFGLRDGGAFEGAGDARSGAAPFVAPQRRSTVRSGVRRSPAVCSGTHAPDLHGSRLTPRGRVVVALVWLVMAGVAALMVATIPGDGAQGAGVVTTKVMVEPGETLWQLAGEVRPGTDRHETVTAIMSLNDLDSASQIRPGDILVVPVEP